MSGAAVARWVQRWRRRPSADEVPGPPPEPPPLGTLPPPVTAEVAATRRADLYDGAVVTLAVGSVLLPGAVALLLEAAVRVTVSVWLLTTLAAVVATVLVAAPAIVVARLATSVRTRRRVVLGLLGVLVALVTAADVLGAAHVTCTVQSTSTTTLCSRVGEALLGRSWIVSVPALAAVWVLVSAAAVSALQLAGADVRVDRSWARTRRGLIQGAVVLTFVRLSEASGLVSYLDTAFDGFDTRWVDRAWLAALAYTAVYVGHTLVSAWRTRQAVRQDVAVLRASPGRLRVALVVAVGGTLVWAIGPMRVLDAVTRRIGEL